MKANEQTVVDFSQYAARAAVNNAQPEDPVKDFTAFVDKKYHAMGRFMRDAQKICDLYGSWRFVQTEQFQCLDSLKLLSDYADSLAHYRNIAVTMRDDEEFRALNEHFAEQFLPHLQLCVFDVTAHFVHCADAKMQQREGEKRKMLETFKHMLIDSCNAFQQIS